MTEILDLHNRDALVASLPKNGIVAEIGVWEGEFAKVILEQSHPKRLYLIDCWEHQPETTYGHDPSNAENPEQRRRHDSVLQRFANDQRVVVLKSFSIPSASLFADRYFDWVYIDANHLQVDRDIQAWLPKIKDDGWLSGHDYTVVGDYIRVQPLVDQFVQSNDLRVHVTREGGYPSWAIQKPQSFGQGKDE